VPLIFLHDVNGFMVGKDAEWSGIIRAGAKMVSAVSTSVVPKITVIVAGALARGTMRCAGRLMIRGFCLRGRRRGMR
jgi:3-methylcrotonyl-CoA carboxylase beta subunit